MEALSIDPTPVIYKPGFIPTVRCHTQPTEIPTCPTSPISSDPRLDYTEMQESEDMTEQLLPELGASDSQSEPDKCTNHSPTPTQDDYNLKDQPEDWLILDEL